MVADIKLLSGAALRPALSELLPEFARASGCNVAVRYGSVGAITHLLRSGEATDVAIVSRPQIDELLRSGNILARNRVDLPDPLGRLDVDNQLQFRRLFERRIARLRTLEVSST